jgi:ankyrin repeat protein
MLKKVKEHLELMRSFCLQDDKQELLDFVHKTQEEGLPLHGIVDGNSNTLLHIACQRNKSTVVKVLIDAGFNPNVKNGYGARPLHAAIMNGAHDCALELIRHKASPP